MNCKHLNDYNINKKLNNKEEMEGQIFYNNYNEKGVVVNYIDSHHVIINTDYNYEVTVSKQSLLKKEWRTPYTPRVCNRGYIGIGKYNPTQGYNDKHHSIATPQYDTWENMFCRCYSDKYLSKRPTYQGCEVCEEWYNFQNFGLWYDDNYWKCGDEPMRLDKDFLSKNNRIYAPDKCIFLPNAINVMLTSCKSVRGDLPIGVTWTKQGRKHYRVRVSAYNTQNKRLDLGTYMTIEEAFQVYKKYKEQEIKRVADLYKSKYPQFPQKLYDAMYNYQVEITD